MNWQVKIIDQGYTFNRDVFIFRKAVGGTEILLGETIQFIKDGEAAPRTPTLSLPPEVLQALADGLADSGYKPSGGFTDGKLEATEKHLEDMRTLVFQKTT